MGKLFGTDGIRGVANTYPMTPETAMKVGKAIAVYFGKNHLHPIIIGKDTRISGDMLEHAVAAGISSVGTDVYLAGVIPTPGIAYLARRHHAAAGVVISASHNPFYDNGIKLFKGDGFKLSDAEESEIESIVLSDHTFSSQNIGRISMLENAADQYAGFLKAALNADLSKMRIILDCGNGATYRTAPKIFKELGAQVQSLFISPDGRNINDDCGSQHTKHLQEAVVSNQADMGFAFDGDGDRVIAIDHTGKIISGDQVLAICAGLLKKQGKLKNDMVVSTVMSNIGLKIALKEMGIGHLMADVGDRYVMEQMLASGAVIGGEDSGHTIFLEHHSTGDGILTALRVVEAVMNEGRSLFELSRIMQTYPQILLNVEVSRKPDIATIPAIKAEIDRVENELGEKGRVLVRYSGTQPLCRVMVEGPTPEDTRRCCEQIVSVVQREIGV